MSAPSMRTRRSRPPGFATIRADATSNGDVAGESSTTAPNGTEPATRQNERIEAPTESTSAPPRQAPTDPQPTDPRVVGEAGASHESVYAGAATGPPGAGPEGPPPDGPGRVGGGGGVAQKRHRGGAPPPVQHAPTRAATPTLHAPRARPR